VEETIVRLPFPATTRTSALAPTQRVANVAHRGASADAPENTLAAVRQAIAGDSDLVELDVQRSKDGALVLLHDTTLARTTDVRRVFPNRAPWLVSDFSLAEIQRLDAGGWKSRDHAGERVPTLAEVIEVVRRSRVGLQLELKAVALHPGIVPETVATLRETPGYVARATAARRLVVQSFDHEAMHAHKELEPSVPVGLLGAPARYLLPELATWADQVNPSHWAADASYVAAVHDQGMACLVWTVNRVAAMRRVLNMGVDGVITDRPDVLHRVLAGRFSSHDSVPTLAAG